MGTGRAASARSMNTSRTTLLLLLALSVIPATGCQTYYRTPGGPAPIGEMTAPSIAEKLRALPEAPMPATLALVRIQGGNYYSSSIAGVRRGRVSIVPASDLEVPADVECLQKWPDVAACVRLSAIIVPEARDTGSDAAMLALREGAATLHADILALYTIDTTFRVDDYSPGALGLVTLGLAPTKSAVVNSTASVAFVDVRTGFVYGTAEASSRDDQLANSWTSEDAVDQCRRRVEREALTALLAEGGRAWQSIAAQRRAQLEKR
jgi:hypothetical protein